MGIVYPPKEVFAHPQLPLAESQGGYGTYNWHQDVCPPEGGILAYYHDEPFPRKGHTYPEAVEANNLIKKLTVGSLLSLAVPEAALSALGFLLLPWKRKLSWLEKILQNYCRMADYANRTHYMQKRFYTAVGRELWDFTYLFLKGLGLSADTAYRTGRIVAHLLEHDDAYRARVQDIAAETHRPLLLVFPRRELLRLTNIYVSREKGGITEKFLSLAKLLSYALLVPRIKTAFVRSAESINLKKMAYDEADRYYVLNRPDYDYLGRSEDDRLKEYIDIHNRFALKAFREKIRTSVNDPQAMADINQQLTNLGVP